MKTGVTSALDECDHVVGVMNFQLGAVLSTV